MTKAEQKTFDKLLKLIIQQGTSGKELLDQLILVSRMKEAYKECADSMRQARHERVVRTK